MAFMPRVYGYTLGPSLREGLCTVKDLAVDAGEPEHVIRKAVRRLVRKKVLTANRSAKPRRFITRGHLSQK